jgi:phosphate-selective porin
MRKAVRSPCPLAARAPRGAGLRPAAALLAAALLLPLLAGAARADDAPGGAAPAAALGEPPAGPAGAGPLAARPQPEPAAWPEPAPPAPQPAAPAAGDAAPAGPGDGAPADAQAAPDAKGQDAKDQDAKDKDAKGKDAKGKDAKDDGGFPLDLKWDGGPVLSAKGKGPRLRLHVTAYADKYGVDDSAYANAMTARGGQATGNFFPTKGGRLGKTDSSDPGGGLSVGFDGPVLPDLPLTVGFGVSRHSYGVRDFFADVKPPPLPCLCLCDPDLRVGNQREPMGLEENTDLTLTTFVTRSAATTTFGLGHSLGAMLHDGLYGGHLGYALGWFYSPDGKDGEFSDRETDETVVRNGQGVTGRVWTMPWVGSRAACRRLLLGASGSVRTGMNGIRFRSRPESETFGYIIDTDFSTDVFGRPLLDDAKSATFLGAEASGVWGRWFAQGEWFLAHVDSARGGDPTFTGGYVMGGLWLTRECRRLECGRRVPSRVCCPLDPCAEHRGWGGLELAARYSTVDLNDGNVLGGTMHNWSVELNWHLGSGRRLMLNYVHAQVNDGTVDEPLDIFQVRVQLGF